MIRAIDMSPTLYTVVLEHALEWDKIGITVNGGILNNFPNDIVLITDQLNKEQTCFKKFNMQCNYGNTNTMTNIAPETTYKFTEQKQKLLKNTVS